MYQTISKFVLFTGFLACIALTLQSCNDPQSLAGPYPEIPFKATGSTTSVSAGLALAVRTPQNNIKPSDECTLPPEISRIAGQAVEEPPLGEFNTGIFQILGRNFQGGEVWIDGPLVVEGPTKVNPAGNLIRKDWSIGCCAPVPGPFSLYVETLCGTARIEVFITGEDVTP